MRARLGYSDIELPNLLSRTMRRDGGGFGDFLGGGRTASLGPNAILKEKRWKTALPSSGGGGSTGGIGGGGGGGGADTRLIQKK